MDAHQEDFNMIMEDSRNMMIIKGKRTKRPRPSSPLALTMASTSSTTTSEDVDHTENPNNTFFHMPTNSIEFTRITPQENDVDEDMANCLILLAQGQSSPPPPPPPPRVSGLYVYECKTCNCGFSSFQALGGHRASHKKPPKPTLEDKHLDNIVHHSSTTLSLQIGSDKCNPMNGSVKASNKVHECSICGAEFGSGQALGGHMRRHRSMPPMATITTCGDSISGGCQESKKSKTSLSLDLNLPAPIEDDHREAKFPFRAKDKMIVFSNSSLVHCHY